LDRGRSDLTSSTEVAGTAVGSIAEDFAWLDGVLSTAIASRNLREPEGLPGIFISDREAAELLERPYVLASEAPEPSIRPWSSPRLAALSQTCSLQLFDQATLLLASAVSIDHRYARLCAYLQDDLTQPYPTPGLALRLFGGGFESQVRLRSRFDATAPLRALDLVRLSGEDQDTLFSRALSAIEAVTAYLLGVESDAPSASNKRELILPDAAMDALTVVEQAWQRSEAQARSVVFIVGEPGSGRRLAASHLAESIGKLIVAAGPHSVDAVRAAVLSGGVLCLSEADELFDADGREARNRLEIALSHMNMPAVVTLSSRGAHLPLRFGGRETRLLVLPPLGTEERTLIWQQEAGIAGIDLEPDSAWLLATTYRLSGGAIVAAIEQATLQDGSTTTALEGLASAAKRMASTNLGRLGQEIAPRFRWQDIVLPEEVAEQLNEIIIRVRHRSQVFGEWGFTLRHARSHSLSALFAGPSGTGKTMAAEVIANELGLPLYRVDLSAVVSKYIGETEKNLSQIFDEASSSSAVLFFDEADALFGKRSEVRDAHDRYANIEVSYLLQRMEDYDGIIILASNLRQNLDDAFIRRLNLIVDFPFPNEAARLEIWRRNLPPSLPLGKDVDLAGVAQRFRLTGGHIRNACVTAAFLAASEGTVVTMSHLMRAVRREHQKMGKLLLHEGEAS
jgi:AAA+ superfamily predicted ATPase